MVPGFLPTSQLGFVLRFLVIVLFWVFSGCMLLIERVPCSSLSIHIQAFLAEINIAPFLGVNGFSFGPGWPFTSR